MVSIRERTTKTGDTTYQAMFRQSGRQTSLTFETRPAAERFQRLAHDLKSVDKAIAALEGDQPADDLLTVDQLAEAFFAWKATSVTARTMRDYRRDYANWIQPWLGHLAADAVDERDVQKLVDHMAARLDPKSVRDRHMILHSMFRYGSARSRMLVDHNPCKETELPARVKKPPKGVTLAEWQALYLEARSSDPDAADLLLFLVGTGWRWSEAVALMVRNVTDLDDRMIVQMAAVFRRDDRDRQVLVEDKAKSNAGLRVAELSGSVAAMVRRRMVGRGLDDLVFTAASGRPWRQGNFLHRTWRGIVERSGIERRPTPHWLRHTHVMLLLRNGVSLPDIQRRLGHESIETTINVYGRMNDGVSVEALEALDRDIVGPAAGQVIAGTLVSGDR